MGHIEKVTRNSSGGVAAHDGIQATSNLLAIDQGKLRDKQTLLFNPTSCALCKMRCCNDDSLAMPLAQHCGSKGLYIIQANRSRLAALACPRTVSLRLN